MEDTSINQKILGTKNYKILYKDEEHLIRYGIIYFLTFRKLHTGIQNKKKSKSKGEILVS